MVKRKERKRIRLPFYDYAQYGCYFVTICTYNREQILGEIIDGKMYLSDVGNIVYDALLSVQKDYINSKIPNFIIMPNHLHFIWFNCDNVSLSFVVKLIKGRASFQYGKIKTSKNYPTHLWQRSFYEHIIRDDRDYEFIAEYIENNPLQWELDALNPINYEK